ncbi:hypothetical protein EDB19DRAFT_1761110, partial [Suillus lakei]
VAGKVNLVQVSSILILRRVKLAHALGQTDECSSTCLRKDGAGSIVCKMMRQSTWSRGNHARIMTKLVTIADTPIPPSKAS